MNVLRHHQAPGWCFVGLNVMLGREVICPRPHGRSVGLELYCIQTGSDQIKMNYHQSPFLFWTVKYDIMLELIVS